MYLESESKLHRDISYTNILLRKSGVDSLAKTVNRKKIMDDLELTQIEELRKELNCREGLLIDFDYGTQLQSEETESAPNKMPGHSGARTVYFPQLQHHSLDA
jgi:serine/threonine protein kinase